MKFLKRIVVDDNGCWLYQGFLKQNSSKLKYGWVSFRNKSMHAHRASWIVHNGEIPNDLFVCHKCDVPHCINPEHLFLGTPKDNMQDMIKKGRKAPWINKGGETNPCSKLTVDQVIEIKQMLSQKITQTKIAELYKVHKATINAIKTKRNWSFVE